MKTNYRTSIATRIWLYTNLLFGIGCIIWIVLIEPTFVAYGFVAVCASSIGSLPVLIVLYYVLPILKKSKHTVTVKYYWLFFTCFILTSCYGVVATLLSIFDYSHFYFLKLLQIYINCTGILFGCSSLAILFTNKLLTHYFLIATAPIVEEQNELKSANQINNYTSIMETQNTPNTEWQNEPTSVNPANKIAIKAVVTAALILLMLIPTLFVQNLVTEREQRQKEVVQEVSSKWASKQTITGPYIHIPYEVKAKDEKGKEIIIEKDLVILPDNLNVSGIITPEQRPRSIYKVLLYKSSLTSNGTIILQLPKDITIEMLRLKDAKVCIGVTDFKGIEEKITIKINGINYELAPGLPTNQIDSSGLSTTINLSIEDFTKPLVFEMPLKIKGSEQLHFVPLSGNSKFALQSTWPNPSFDGNNLPSDRIINDKGFTAKWVFNKANLPFGTVLKNAEFNKNNFAFGVSMLQPADQYAKTMRSVKYAILFIGLTFGLFFIIELMQKKPVHPVQYVLIGLALVIFYTLLLSISEFILFDFAYLIASLATILLITFYAHSHFKNAKTASVFGGVLSTLYGFIFILIRLEDTALLVGSIGLFIVLALVMYASRKINWYKPSFSKSEV